MDISDMITKTELKRRGWTDSVIRKYLPEPDGFRRNPYYNNAPDVQLYKMSRIVELEHQEDVSEALQKAARRSEARKRSAERQSEKLFEYIKHLNVDVPVMPYDVLIDKACEHYNLLWWNRGKYDKYADPQDSSASFLHRIAVNYLRHCMTDYEDELELMFGKTGCVQARMLLKIRILGSIAATYPVLDEACQSQRDSLQLDAASADNT